MRYDRVTLKSALQGYSILSLLFDNATLIKKQEKLSIPRSNADKQYSCWKLFRAVNNCAESTLYPPFCFFTYYNWNTCK